MCEPHVHPAAAAHETDPVCGMKVDPAGPLRSEWDGRTWHFCGAVTTRGHRDEVIRNCLQNRGYKTRY